MIADLLSPTFFCRKEDPYIHEDLLSILTDFENPGLPIIPDIEELNGKYRIRLSDILNFNWYRIITRVGYVDNENLKLIDKQGYPNVYRIEPLRFCHSITPIYTKVTWEEDLYDYYQDFKEFMAELVSSLSRSERAMVWKHPDDITICISEIY